MLKLVATADDDGQTFEVPLMDEHDKPTKTLWCLLAAEFIVDIYLGYAAYRFFKNRADRRKS